MKTQRSKQKGIHQLTETIDLGRRGILKRTG